MIRSDAKIADIGRRLAEALQDWGYTRKSEDKQRVLAAEVELINAVKEEANVNARV